KLLANYRSIVCNLSEYSQSQKGGGVWGKWDADEFRLALFHLANGKIFIVAAARCEVAVYTNTSLIYCLIFPLLLNHTRGSSVQYVIPCFDDVTSNALVTLTPNTDMETALNNSPHFQEFARRHILLTG
ncbi:hypothetical protein T06_9741, partial [Trichinella sp. T6]